MTFPGLRELPSRRRPQRHEACTKEAWNESCNREANCSSSLPPASRKTSADAQCFWLPWQTALEQSRGDPEHSQTRTCSTAQAARSTRSVPCHLPRLQPRKQPGAPHQVSVQRQFRSQTTSSCFAVTLRRSGPGASHHIRQLSWVPGGGGTHASNHGIGYRQCLACGAPGAQQPRPATNRCPARSSSPFVGRQTGQGTAHTQTSESQLLTTSTKD